MTACLISKLKLSKKYITRMAAEDILSEAAILVW